MDIRYAFACIKSGACVACRRAPLLFKVRNRRHLLHLVSCHLRCANSPPLVDNETLLNWLVCQIYVSEAVLKH